MWLGLLFSMISLTLLTSGPGEHSPMSDGRPVLDTYREKIVQCLVLGEYTKGGRHTFECFYHYLTLELSIRSDADKDIWILLGIGVNLAFRMGYHRDSSNFPRISPFTAEMRRRGWATLLQGDILISTQMGMPRMINDRQCDTPEPQNLNDYDFDQDTQILPPPRPAGEITTASSLIASRRIFTALGVIVDLTTAVHQETYAEVMRVDRILRDAEASLPSYLRIKPMASALTDPPTTIMHRLFLRLMFHKGQIMLHRRYLSSSKSPGPDKGQDTYAYSRTSCLEAALGILEIQRIFYEETNPDGQLSTMRWRVSSITAHEFLTATIVLCFLAQHDLESLISESSGYVKDEIVTALKTAHIIWIRSSTSSVEARVAANALRIVLGKMMPQEELDGSSIAPDRSEMDEEMPFNPG